MKRFGNFLIASVGFLIFVLAVTLTDIGRTVAQSTGDCIKLCTDDSAPLATRIAGAVQIASSPSNAVRTRATLQFTDVFQKEVKMTLDPGVPIGGVKFNVPQSRLLVIEAWDGFVDLPFNNGVPQVKVRTTANGETASHQVWTIANLYGGGGYLLVPFGSMKVYADPGSEIVVSVQRQGTIGTANLSLTLTGHYIDQ